MGPVQAPTRLLVVSHPAVVAVNQEVYRELSRRGWEVTIVLPARWRSEYSGQPMAPQALEGMEPALRPTRVALRGRPQRHLYLTRCAGACSRIGPDVAFLEAEPYSLAASQWSFALGRRGVPFGVQCYENIDRPLPAPVRALRSRVLRRAAFVAARSDSAACLVRSWGARGEVGFAPPAVPPWETSAGAGQGEDHAGSSAGEERRAAGVHDAGRNGTFTIGYAGRLVQSKGLDDLLGAVRRLVAPVELLLIGDGEQRPALQSQPIPGSRVRVLSGLSHERMADGYAQLDVLVLPSRTTATWKEQFGRVIVEALWCGVPVVGSDSGEIPWLIGLTGGGLVFAEGDVEGLAAQLETLRESPRLREDLARRGREAVEQLFTVPRATDRLESLLVGALRSGAQTRGKV